MVFNQELVDEWFDVLHHESQNRHEVVITVVDKLKLNGFYFALKFHLLLNGLRSFFLDFLKFALKLNFLLLLYLLLRIGHLSEVFEVVLHDQVHIKQIYQACEQHNFGGNHFDISSLQQKAFLAFIVRVELAK